jgi:DNA-binding NarL/FixJ family response regulator
MTARGAHPVRIAVLNDYEVVVRGVVGMLIPYRDRVVVVECDSAVPTLSDVDVVLFDTFSRFPGEGIDLAAQMSAGETKVVVFAWAAEPSCVALALAQGAAGYLSKCVTALQLVEALEAVHRGETVTIPIPGQCAAHGPGDWPGRSVGLSAREAEALAWVAGGLRNEQVGEKLHVSINTVKSNIRSAYRKIGVSTRSQAVVWALEHGFVPKPERQFAHETRGAAEPGPEGWRLRGHGHLGMSISTRDTFRSPEGRPRI